RRSSRVSLAAPARGGSRRSYTFGGAQGAQQVAAGQGGTVRFGPAAAEQLGEQGRVGGDVLQAGRDLVGAVEVAAQAHMLDAGYLADVLDVVRNLRQRRPGPRMSP